MDDPYRLERFVVAQDRSGTYRRAVVELRAGRKQSHWMWFVFPQLAGLGFSSMAQEFAIESLAAARAYLAHPILGPRLAECAHILNALDVAGAADIADPDADADGNGASNDSARDGKTATQILGPVDAMKLRSSMTLFAAAAPAEQAFADVLTRYFDGKPDEATLQRLR
jgi:uncharacterized protein (DUF1810 family)